LYGCQGRFTHGSIQGPSAARSWRCRLRWNGRPSQRRVGRALYDEADRPRACIEFEEEETCGLDAGEAHDPTADRLRGGLRRVAPAQAADRLPDERPLPRELGRVLLKFSLMRHVALDGHVACDRPRGVADGRNDDSS